MKAKATLGHLRWSHCSLSFTPFPPLEKLLWIHALGMGGDGLQLYAGVSIL